MKITDVVKVGNLSYLHHYRQTTNSEETCSHTLSVPKHLITLAENNPDAEIVTFGDDTIGIEIGGKLWAAEVPHAEFRPAKALPHEVWQYCNLAMGRNGDTFAR